MIETIVYGLIFTGSLIFALVWKSINFAHMLIKIAFVIGSAIGLINFLIKVGFIAYIW